MRALNVEWADSTAGDQAATISTMAELDLNVVHLVGCDTPPTRWETLRAIREHPELGRHRVVQIGGGELDAPDVRIAEKIGTPFGAGWLAGRSLQSVSRWIGRTIFHVWSPRALEWVVPAVAGDGGAHSHKGRATSAFWWTSNCRPTSRVWRTVFLSRGRNNCCASCVRQARRGSGWRVRGFLSRTAS